MSLEVAQTLENITEISFKIIDIYKKLIELEKTKDTDFNYHNKKKTLLEQLSYYKSLEDDEYNFFKGRTYELIEAIMLFKNDINTNFTIIVNNKDEDLIKQRIIDRLQNLIVTNEINAKFNFSSSLGKTSYSVEFETELKNSIAHRKASYELEEINNTNNTKRRNLFIENFYYETFITSKLENTLLKRNYESVPLNLSVEINNLKTLTENKENAQAIIDDKILGIILSSILPELIILDLPLENLSNILALKILILYLSKDAFNELKWLISSLPFTSAFIKDKTLEILNYNDKEKNKQNSDLFKKF